MNHPELFETFPLMVPVRFSNLNQRVKWRLIGMILIVAAIVLALPISRASLSVSVPTVPAAFKRLAPSAATTKQHRPEFVAGELLVRFRRDAIVVNKAAGARSEIVVTEGSHEIPVQLERLTDGTELVEGLRLARVCAGRC